MGFKVNVILYGMQRQPGQPILVNHLIGVLACVLKPLAELPLSIAVPRYVILSESFTFCRHVCHTTSFRANCSLSVNAFAAPHHSE